jgi:predicted dehydrogenase
MKKYNWAILGCGKIASKFAQDLNLLDRAIKYAAASRSLQKASDFAEDYGFELFYDSYEKLVGDPQVDIVYIATPHNLHKEHTLLALENGKAVLCEKAFGLNALEVRQMIQKAKTKNLFLMEAFWTQFKPKFLKTQEILEQKTFGELKFLRSDFLFNGPYDPNNRLYNIELGGGSLLDIGIYPVFMALALIGRPDSILATAQYSPTGSEQSVAMLFKYKNGALASLSSSFEAWSKNDTELCFTDASLRFSRDEQEEIIVLQDKVEHQIKTQKLKGLGYYLEAEHVMDCLEKGLSESPVLPLNFSLELIEVLDEIRKQIDVVYPADKPT